MPDIKGAVTKKVGPLPLWGWAVAGVAAVFVVGRFKGGGSSSSAGGQGIKIPTLTPGSPSEPGGGSPGQNAGGGMDTQPGGTAPPWWSHPPDWWAIGPGGGHDTANTPGGGGNLGGQSNMTAGALAASGTPGFTRTSPTNVVVQQPNGTVGNVAPTNVLVRNPPNAPPGLPPIFQ